MHSLKHILGAYFQQNPIHKGVDLSMLYKNWDILLGDYLSKRIIPVNFERGTLICCVSSSSLIQELKLGLSKEILCRLQQIDIGAPIRDLRIVSESAALPSRILKDFKQIIHNEQQLKQKVSIRHMGTLSDSQKSVVSDSTERIPQAETRQKARQFMLALAKRQSELQAHHWSVCHSCQTYYSPHLQKCPFCCLGDKK